MATLPQGNQELLVVRDKVGRTPDELGVSKSMEYHPLLQTPSNPGLPGIWPLKRRERVQIN